MLKSIKLGAILSGLLALTACEMSSNEDRGTMIGGVGGALAGAAIGGAVAGDVGGALVGGGVGALVGGLAGNRIGNSMDRDDEREYERARQESLDNQRPSSWKSAKNDNHGDVKTIRSYTDYNGRECSDQQHTMYIGGERSTRVQKVCKVNGNWTVVN